jgi:endogenous inhibitor of DNA gyrase (YacG/DUF329 family)
MSYDKKLLEQKRKYGLVKCPICGKFGRPDWNIYSANAFCSIECGSKWINKIYEKNNKNNN